MPKSSDKPIKIGFATNLPGLSGGAWSPAVKPAKEARESKLSYSSVGLTAEQAKAMWEAIPGALDTPKTSHEK